MDITVIRIEEQVNQDEKQTVFYQTCPSFAFGIKGQARDGQPLFCPYKDELCEAADDPSP